MTEEGIVRVSWLEPIRYKIVIASGAKQSSGRRRAGLDCFVGDAASQ
jgi:hypothetical protein